MKQARRLGLTQRQLQGATWRRLLRGTYIDSAAAEQSGLDEHTLRVMAALLVIPPNAVIAGLSAAWLYGVKLLSPDAPVEVVVPPERWRGPMAGLTIWRAPLAAEDITREQPRRTAPLRTAWDIACRAEAANAVAALDAMVAARLVSQTELAALAQQPGRWRRHRARELIEMVDVHAESPQESRLRVQLMAAGLPRPVCQFAITTPLTRGEQLVARVDLAWPQNRVAVEYDGQWHAAPDQLRRDRARLNRIVTAGWQVIHVTDDRLRGDIAGIVREVRAALQERPATDRVS